jgi:hypothetical protein
MCFSARTFSASLLSPFFASLIFITFLSGLPMSNLDARQLAQRIDTVLDILVGGDTHSAINNLEILKAELLAQASGEQEHKSAQPKSPWEI